MTYFELVSINESTSVYHRDEFTAFELKGEPYQTNMEWIRILKVREAQEDKFGLSSGVYATRWYLHSTKNGILSKCKTKKELINELIYYTGNYADKHGGCL